MKVILSKRAVRAVGRIAARWQDHADDPYVFAREYLEVLELLETTRSPGSPVPWSRRPGLKRLLLKKSHCHVYFEIDDQSQIVKILQLWDGRRARPPKL